MCNLDRPVYRFGRIIRGDSALRLNEGEAAVVADALVASSEKLTTKVVEALRGVDLKGIDLIDVSTAGFDITAELANPDRDQAEVQYLPVILVNFPKIRLVVGDAVIEFRFCITVCIDHKKSKCWLRFNLEPGEGPVRGRFFRLVTQLSELIIDTVVSGYRDVIRTNIERHNTVELFEHYTMDIKSASSGVEALEDAYNVRFGDFHDAEKVKFNEKVVLRHFGELDSTLTQLPSQEWSTNGAFQERLVGYKSTREFSHKFGPEVREQLHALMILRFGEKRAHFYTVGYDPLPEKIEFENRFASMGHIISLNVSSEYARKF